MFVESSPNQVNQNQAPLTLNALVQKHFLPRLLEFNIVHKRKRCVHKTKTMSEALHRCRHLKVYIPKENTILIETKRFPCFVWDSLVLYQ